MAIVYSVFGARGDGKAMPRYAGGGITLTVMAAAITASINRRPQDKCDVRHFLRREMQPHQPRMRGDMASARCTAERAVMVSSALAAGMKPAVPRMK